MTLPPETQLGRYKIRSLIGSGGMGEVYLAQDTSLQRKVALKVLPVELAANQDRMRRFKQEAMAAASLNHPNIAHIYEIGEVDGFNFIAMEYVQGRTLREKIHDDREELAKLLVTAYSDEPPREWLPKAKEAALKALELDDKLAEAHASLGQIAAYYDYDFVTAEREYRRALELNPNYPSAHQWLAEHLGAMKRFDEAIAEIRRALELDPLSVIINRVYADILVEARRVDEAIEQFHRTIELDPNFPTSHYFLGRAYEMKGMYDQATTEYTTSAALSGASPEQVAKMHDVYAKSGWKAYVQTHRDVLRPAWSKGRDVRVVAEGL